MKIFIKRRGIEIKRPIAGFFAADLLYDLTRGIDMHIHLGFRGGTAIDLDILAMPHRLLVDFDGRGNIYAGNSRYCAGYDPEGQGQKSGFQTGLVFGPEAETADAGRN